MSIFSRLFGGGFPDEQLITTAQRAINSDTLIRDQDTLVVSSKKGVVTLAGIVPKEEEKVRIEGVVRDALTKANLKHESLVNELKMPHR
jgi:osmotically-inducible protein OsmY